MSRKKSIEKAQEFLPDFVPNPAPVESRKGMHNKPPKKKKFMSPEEMFIHFQAFRVKRKAEPFLIEDFGSGKNGVEIVHMNREKVLTMDGFQIYLMENGIIMSIDHILANTGNFYEAYLSTVAAIRRIIKDDQITGAMGGVYNANLTSRLNDLAEKKETKNLNLNFDIEMDLT